MKTVKRSYVYVLINHDRTMYKIGRTNNIERRMLELEYFWGKFDLKDSYAIECDRVFVSKLEKLLQYLVLDSQMYFVKEDRKMGHSEFFNYSSFNKLKKFVRGDLKKFKQEIEFIEMREITQKKLDGLFFQ